MPDSSKSLLSPYLSLSARLLVSAIVSLVTAVLVYLSLPWLMVRPMRRLIESMMAFHLTLS